MPQDMMDSAPTQDSTLPRPMVWGLIVYIAVMLAVAGTFAVRVYHSESEKIEKLEQAKKDLENKTEKPAGEPKPEAAKPEGLTTARYIGATLAEPFFLWGLLNAIVGGVGLLWASSRRAVPAESDTPTTGSDKILLVTVGGMLGFLTTLCLGCVAVWRYWLDFTRGREIWNEAWPWYIVAAIVGGLVIMFLSLVAVRSEERHNPTLRRLIYGYNAVLVGLLLLAILTIINTLFFIYGPTAPTDWTKNNIYSISGSTKRMLQNLEKPAKVYCMLSSNDIIYEDMKNLLENCQSASNGKLEVVFLLPNSRRDNATIQELVNKYALLDFLGMLVVYDPDGKPQHLFVKRDSSGPDDLGLEEAPQRGRGDSIQRLFKGEIALKSALASLSEGKAKSVIYVTQGHGELELTDATTPGRNAIPTRSRGMGALKTKLERSGYEVKELRLGGLDLKTNKPQAVPDDAVAVVIAGGRDYPKGMLQALDEYLAKPQGRLLVLLDNTLEKNGELRETGIEPFLAKYGVTVGKDIIISVFAYQEARDALQSVNFLARTAEDAFLNALDPRLPVPLLGGTRPVRTGSVPTFDVKPLLAAPTQRVGQWSDDAVKGDPNAYLENLIKTQREAVVAKVEANTPPIPTAVTVRTRKADAEPPMPGRMPMPAPGDPKMIVFGNTVMANNAMIDGSQDTYYNLLASAITWLRGKDPVVTAEQPKTRDIFRSTLSPEEATYLFWVPPGLLILAVIACGIAVGIIRRK